MLCFRDYTTLLWMKVQPSPAQPPTCSLGLVPEPQTPAGIMLSTRLGQTPVGPRAFMLVQKGNSLRGTAHHEAVQRWTPDCPLKLFHISFDTASCSLGTPASGARLRPRSIWEAGQWALR